MTNQSHTELAARLRNLANWIDKSVWMSPEMASAPKTIHEAAAALESPERVQGQLVTIRLPTLTPEQAADVHWGLSEALVAADRMDDGRMLLFVGEATTPSPQAEKQPLSLDEIRAWAVRRMSALGPEGVTDPVAFLEEGVRWGEAQHGIVTKEST